MFNSIYKERKVLVTGHTGFKGSWLCRWLQILGRGLAQPGVSHDGDSLRVDGMVGFEIVENAAQPPRPRGDRAPLAGSWFAVDRVHPVLEAIVEIGIDVAAVDGH